MTIILRKSQIFMSLRGSLSEAKTTKQSTNETFESLENFLLYANLWFDLSFHFSIIDFYFLLDSRDLDTSLHFVSLSMTKKEVSV